MARMLRFLSPLFLGWLAILAALTAALAVRADWPPSDSRGWGVLPARSFPSGPDWLSPPSSRR